MALSNKRIRRKRQNDNEDGFSYVEYFKEYASKTSFHGVQYLGEANRHLAERIWWFIMITLSLISCSYLIWAAWTKWNESPVIVSFADTSTPVWKIPFPAVTICSDVKIKQSVLNITDLHQKYPDLSDEELFKYESASMVCDKTLFTTGNDTASPEAIELIFNTSQVKDDIFEICYWRQEYDSIDCGLIFFRIITEEGMCYTFNMLNFNQFWRSENLHSNFYSGEKGIDIDSWDLDNGYDPKTKRFYLYPYRAAGYGTETGLTIILKTFKGDMDYKCKKSTDGFKVALHMPVELPRMAQYYFRVSLDTEIVAAIVPTIITTSEKLRTYSPEKRKCYFDDERYLKYFKVYTQKNCEIECISNYTEFSCGCVEYHMPRDQSIPVCASAKRNCSVLAQDELLTIEVGLEDEYKTENDPDVYKKKVALAANCNCLPSCTSITYETDISQNKYHWTRDYDEEKLKKTKGWSKSLLKLYYKDSQFLTAERYELTGLIDFLANCGGLLGLCMGFSMLSLLEIFYFLTIRAIFKCRKQKEETIDPKQC